MSRGTPRASGYFRTDYAQDLALTQTRLERASLLAFAVMLAAFPFLATAFYLDLACQVFLAAIGALSLMLLTGYAGQISLGHAGLLAAGAFTAGILFREFNAPFWVTLPAAAAVGALLGIVFGLPSLRLRGLYLAVSTLALHFVVVYLGGEYESKRGFSTGIMIDPPTIGGYAITNGRVWYFVLLAAAAIADLHQSPAQPDRARLARHSRARNRRRGARHQYRGLQAARLCDLIRDGVGGGRPVRLLPPFRLGRGVLAFSVDSICRDDHCRRHGIVARRVTRRRVRDAVPVSDRSRAAEAAERAELRRRSVCGQLRRLRRGDDLVPAV